MRTTRHKAIDEFIENDLREHREKFLRDIRLFGREEAQRFADIRRYHVHRKHALNKRSHQNIISECSLRCLFFVLFAIAFSVLSRTHPASTDSSQIGLYLCYGLFVLAMLISIWHRDILKKRY